MYHTNEIFLKKIKIYLVHLEERKWQVRKLFEQYCKPNLGQKKTPACYLLFLHVHSVSQCTDLLVFPSKLVCKWVILLGFQNVGLAEKNLQLGFCTLMFCR